MRPFFQAIFVLVAMGCHNPRIESLCSDNSIPNICEIISHPDDYRNKVIKVKGVYFDAPEAASLGDKKCGWSTWVVFDQKAIINSTPSEWAKLKDISKHWDAKVKVVFIGTIEGQKPPILVNGKQRKLGFGHLGAYDYQFTVTGVECVSTPYSAYE